MFHNFPYTDEHELNLDWFLEQFKDLKKSLEAGLNVIKALPSPAGALKGKVITSDGDNGWALDYPSDPDLTYLKPSDELSENVLTEIDHRTRNYQGLVYEYDASSELWNITGTTVALSFKNLFNGLDPLTMPSGIFPGVSYKIIFSSPVTDLKLQVLQYNSSSELIRSNFYTEDGIIDVSPNAAGMIIRFYIETGVTINTDVSDPMIMTVSDDTNNIVQMLNANGKCVLGPGLYSVNEITMPINSMLIGCGRETVLKFNGDVSTSQKAVINATDGCTVEKIRIIGSDDVPSNIHTFDDPAGNLSGIYITGPITDMIHITDVEIHNCDRSGITLTRTGGTVNGAAMIDRCVIKSCWVGIRLGLASEYNKVSNCIIARCNRGMINIGGNNVITGCTIHGIAGILIDGSSNSGHGSCIGCTFNHIDSAANPDTLGGGRAVFIADLVNGFVFDGCQFWYSKISIARSRGVLISNSQMGDARQAPSITVTGTYPAFFNGIIFHQTPSITDQAGSKFDNCYVDSDGTIVH